MAYKTSSIDLNVPAKVIPVDCSNLSSAANWEYQNGTDDRWWSGGSNPKPYRWNLTLTLQNASGVDHGSHLTRTPFKFNAFDIVVGDFVVGSNDGRAVKIISISAKTATTVTCIVEDALRYNTFRSSTGSGIFGVPGAAIVLQINENGHPMVDPLPLAVVTADFYANLNSRFQYLNPQLNYLLDQNSHGFEEGDVVAVNASTRNIEKVTTASRDRVIGTVTHAGPGPNQFLLRPQTGIIDFVPALPGDVGDFIYTKTDGSGDLTTADTGKPVFLKVANAITSLITGTVLDPTGTVSDVITINNHDVPLNANTGGQVLVSDAVSDINGYTSDHGVTAIAGTGPFSVTTSNSVGLAFGIVGGGPPFSATINGTLVNFTTTTSGTATFGTTAADAVDIAADINAAGITNVTASGIAGGNLTITNSAGGSITIVNGTNDSFASAPFAGSTSITGINTSNPASPAALLKLQRLDGGEIIVEDKVGTPMTDFGLISGHNGRYALGLYVEQGSGSGALTTYATLANRNAAVGVIQGDMAFVTNTGEGEWALYLYDGAQWIKISDEDSASTDSNSIETTFTAGNIPGIGTGYTHTLGRVSPGSRIVSVLVEVTTPFSGGTQDPLISVGTQADIDALHEQDDNDLETVGNYTTTPGYVHPSSSGTELEVKTKIDHYNATAGEVKVTVSYV